MSASPSYSPDQFVRIDYVNYRGERAMRTIVPLRITFDHTEWHPELQWLLDAFDLEKQAERTFAMQHILSWQPVAPGQDHVPRRQ
jgi:predicted DNA-binding transcriptional regulator YafY